MFSPGSVTYWFCNIAPLPFHLYKGDEDGVLLIELWGLDKLRKQLLGAGNFCKC